MNTFHLLQVICVLAITLVSAIIDVRQRRIPNLLTAPFLLAGILFHLTASGRFGYGPLVDGVLGMLVATLILGCMWVAGGTGAGDVKLMMGLGMWVGLQTVLYVMLGSLVTSLCLLLAVIGLRKIGINTGIELSPTGPSAQPAGTSEKKVAGKRGIPYALGVCLATWLLIGGQLVLRLNQAPPAPAASSPAVPEATTAAASLPESAR
jgi:hypothetical protein